MIEKHRNSLQPGYRLHWYVIKSILGQGGFGITYLAEDTNLNQEVAIKEYLPVELAVREQDESIHPVSGEYGEQFTWGLDRFMSEAQTLAQFKHPNIVRVLTVFPENNTAYMVMEYEKGQGMHELLKDKKILAESELLNIFLPILDGLEQVHSAGFIHRDIKPPNIFIRADGSPVLLDFGSARHSLGEKTRTLTSMVSPGYAPFEQYVSKSDKQGPWTDIYGLAATLYRSVSGRSPAESMDRSEALLHTQRDAFVGVSEIKPEGYSSTFLTAIDHGLAFKATDRPQSIHQWREEFTGQGSGTIATEAETIQYSPTTENLAESGASQTSPKITMKAGEIEDSPTRPEQAERKRAWYRKPFKRIAVISGILLLLAILDDNSKTNKTDTATDDKGGSPVANLLKDAKTDIEALRLTSPENNNAFDKYRQVLDLEPDNKAALAGIDNVAAKYIGLARSSLAAGEPGQASDYLDKAVELNSEDPDIAALKSNIAVAHNLSQPPNSESDVAPEKLTDAMTASDRRKFIRLKKLLERNPDSAIARQEIRRLSGKYEALVKKAMNEKKYEQAESYVLEMLTLVPDNKKLQDLLLSIRKKTATD